MKKSVITVSIGAAILISSSASAFWGSDINIEKDRAPLAPRGVEKNNNEAKRKVFEVDKSALPAVKQYLVETKSLYKLKYIDFANIAQFDATQLQLSYVSDEAKLVKNQYVDLISSVKEVVDVKVQQRQQAILDNEKRSKNYEIEIASLQENQQGYRTTVQAVYDLKEQTIKAEEISEQAVKDYSALLAEALNEHAALSKPLKSKHFERPKMKAGSCKEAVVSKKTSVQLAYDVQGFCFTSKIKVKKNSADILLNDAQMMSELESKMTAIALEKIKQGDTYKKEGGVAGYKQEIKAFSQGGIENVKRAAKAQYGSTDKGFDFKIKALNKKLAANNRKIVAQKKNVFDIPVRELRQSQALNALKPKIASLDTLIAKYLDAYYLNFIGEPIKQSSEDYKVMGLDASKGILIVEDSYPSDGNQQLEVYLINPTILQENAAIKKQYDGKNIPTVSAAKVNGLLLWRGKEINNARISRSLVTFLSRL